MSLAPQITNHRKIPIEASSDFCFFSWLLGKILSLSLSLSAPPRAHSLRLFLLLLAHSDKTKDEEVWDQKKYFEKVLDDVVALNGLFTVAVFLGLNYAQPGVVQSLNDDRSCDPGTNMRKRVVAFEIVSFSFFVFSGITAKSVKVFLYTAAKMDALEERKNKNDKGSSNEGTRNFFSIPFTLRKNNAQELREKKEIKEEIKQEKRKAHQNWMCVGGFYLSVYGTMVGCFLLLLAMFDVVQIKLGRLACHSKSLVATVSVMVCVIGLSLLIYFFTVTNGLKIAAQEIKADNIDRREKVANKKRERKEPNPQQTVQVVTTTE